MQKTDLGTVAALIRSFAYFALVRLNMIYFAVFNYIVYQEIRM